MLHLETSHASPVGKTPNKKTRPWKTAIAPMHKSDAQPRISSTYPRGNRLRGLRLDVQTRIHTIATYPRGNRLQGLRLGVQTRIHAHRDHPDLAVEKMVCTRRAETRTLPTPGNARWLTRILRSGRRRFSDR
jgi:hypothetical protein